MKKKKLVEVKISVTLDRKPTPEELDTLRKVFPGTPISILESWERESKI